jgi:hypothetical protein
VNLTRIAWLASIVAPVLLIGLLGLVKAASSPAAPLPTGSVEEDCIDWEEGVLDCEPAEESAGPGAPAPEECLLRSARARVLSYDSRNRLRLVVRYTTYAPTRAYLDFRALSGPDTLGLGVVKRHLGRSGVVRLNEVLGAERMEQVRAAGNFELTLEIPSTPGYCQGYFELRLDQKRVVRAGTVWLQSAPVAPALG